MRRLFLSISLTFITVSLFAQSPGVDNATIARIRGEAMTQSQAMDTHWWLSEGLGPRATGTPGYQAAADWAMKKFNEWGLKNVHIERFPFGQGWSIDRFSVHLLTPQPAALVGQPRWYSPSTRGLSSRLTIQGLTVVSFRMKSLMSTMRSLITGKFRRGSTRTGPGA